MKTKLDIAYYFWLQFLFYFGIVSMSCCLVMLIYGDMEISEKEYEVVNSLYYEGSPHFKMIYLFKLDKKVSKKEYFYLLRNRGEKE